MTGLSLIPNETVGYRIKPDWYSYNVVLVKRHGAGSKNAGQEYEKPIAYCRDIAGAVRFILLHAVRVRAEVAQEERNAIDGSIASLEALSAQFEPALAEALAAAAELQARINALPMSQKQLVKALGAPADTEDADAADAA